jgi:hypothetical protein
MVIDFEFEEGWNILLEDVIFAQLEALGVDPALWEFYRAWFYAKSVIRKRFSGAIADAEVALLNAEFVSRGLDLAILEELEPYVDTWAELYRGEEETPYNKLKNGSFESDLDYWVLLSGTLPDVTTLTPQDGLKCIRQHYYSGAMRAFTVRQTGLSIETDKVVACYVWARRTLNANVLNFRVTYTDNTYTETNPLLTGTYTKYLLSLTPGKVIKWVETGCQIDSSYVDMDDRTYIDNVHIDVQLI